MQQRIVFIAAACVIYVLAFAVLQAPAQTRAVGEYFVHDPGCADQWSLQGTGSNKPLPAVPELTHGFSGGTLKRQLCLVGVVAPGGVYLDQTVFAVAEAPAGPVVQELSRPLVSGNIPIADCWPATLGFDDLNDDQIPDIVMMLECQDRNARVYARPNAVYLSRGRDVHVHWVQDARINEDLSLFTTYEELLMGARAFFEVEPATSAQQSEVVRTGQTVTLRGEVRDCDGSGDAVACTVVFSDGAIHRIAMRADPDLMRGRLGTPDIGALAGREVIVEGEVDARGELVRVHSMRLAE